MHFLDHECSRLAWVDEDFILFYPLTLNLFISISWTRLQVISQQDLHVWSRDWINGLFICQKSNKSMNSNTTNCSTWSLNQSLITPTISIAFFSMRLPPIPLLQQQWCGTSYLHIIKSCTWLGCSHWQWGESYCNRGWNFIF